MFFFFQSHVRMHAPAHYARAYGMQAGDFMDKEALYVCRFSSGPDFKGPFNFGFFYFLRVRGTIDHLLAMKKCYEIQGFMVCFKPNPLLFLLPLLDILFILDD